MYRDDTCAVCGVALPPDHVYCREHAAQVDARLHDIGRLLERILGDLPALARLAEEIAPETWEWLSDAAGRDEAWPPPLPLKLRVHADQVEVDVDSEPGLVRIDLTADVAPLLAAVSRALLAGGMREVARACAVAEGANPAY